MEPTPRMWPSLTPLPAGRITAPTKEAARVPMTNPLLNLWLKRKPKPQPPAPPKPPVPPAKQRIQPGPPPWA